MGLRTSTNSINSTWSWFYIDSYFMGNGWDNKESNG